MVFESVYHGLKWQSTNYVGKKQNLRIRAKAVEPLLTVGFVILKSAIRNLCSEKEKIANGRRKT